MREIKRVSKSDNIANFIDNLSCFINNMRNVDSINKSMNFWICCQIGAREHYAIPVALQEQNKLKYLITDSWVSSNFFTEKSPSLVLPKLRERYNPKVNNIQVKHFTTKTLIWELQQKLSQVKGWNLTIARNHWWQQKVIEEIEKLKTL